MNIKDKDLLYYQVGEKKFHSDLHAFQHFTQNLNQSLSFNINYKFFNDDWTTEPKETISHYRAEMCEQIAQSYDKIIIAYSGGTDSETIVDEFKKKQIKNIELLFVTNDINSTVESRKWLEEHMEVIIKQKHNDAIQNLGWTFRIGEKWELQDNKTFERTLTDYQEGCWQVDYKYLTSWHQNSNDNLLTRNTKQKTCIVFGKEKPEIVIKDGWWCFQLLNCDWEQPFDCIDPDTDLVFFYTSDHQPDLLKKISHVKADEMEKIFKENKIKPTEDNSRMVSGQSSPYRERLLQAMGYQAMSRFLNTDATRPLGGWQKEIEIEQQLKIDPKFYNDRQLLKNDFFDTVIEKTIDNRFLDIEQRKIHGIWGKPIRIKPVSEDLWKLR